MFTDRILERMQDRRINGLASVEPSRVVVVSPEDKRGKRGIR